ncbi:hypothetical protein HHK36_014229 [Tetracentron sinense]|uniref:Oxidative stress 3 n=1 Tax=Tetracentron sinense TaxID=13715 RepID=A0A834ZBV0_TETSI|nr:hypothetical protein HHK36_014229 [Tetracentron sinense]
MEGIKQMFKEPISTATDSNDTQQDHWVIMEGDDDICDSGSTISSFEDSTTSAGSSSSTDLVEDASSSTSYSSSSSSLSNGPLYELSELMAQLPMKRGLSKYFQGKSQSFTSLSSVRCIEDLAKRESPYRKKMKSCKSYGGGLDTHRSYAPKPTISKKASRGSFSSSLGKRGSFLGSCRPPLIPMQKN